MNQATSDLIMGVAVITNGAVKKTTALMSDDLAVNAGVVDGVHPDRELPIVKAIFIGSLLNKVYCIAGVLILMAAYPPLIQWIMFVGGLYLCYEGVHKIFEKLFHKKNHENIKQSVPEKEKIKGAIRTDLILSIEIIVIAKSALSGSFMPQVLTLVAVGLAASVLIYGLVALIVKVDDFGLHLIRQGYKKMGMLFVNSMPYTMKTLGIVGTLAMLLVGGGIIAHIFHFPHVIFDHLQNLIVGLIAGATCLTGMELKDKIYKH